MHSSWVYSTTSISGYRVTSQKLIRGGKERENLPGVPVIYQVLPPEDLRPAEPKATRLRLLSPAARQTGREVASCHLAQPPRTHAARGRVTFSRTAVFGCAESIS